MKQLGKAYAPWLAEPPLMLSVRKSNIGKTRIKSTAYWEEFLCCRIRRQRNKLVPGKNRAFFFKKNTNLDSVLLPSLSMGLPTQGAKKAASGPKGVQMQQTDLPAGYNMFPEGAI